MSPAICRASLRSLSPTPLSSAVLAYGGTSAANGSGSTLRPLHKICFRTFCARASGAVFAPVGRSPRRYGHRADPVGSASRRRHDRHDRLRSYLQGRPSPGPLHRTSSRSVAVAPDRLQVRRIHPSRPRSAARIERRHSRQLKQAVCAVTPCAPLRERCSLRSLRFGPPSPGRAGGRPRARSPSSASLQKETCHGSCSPEAGRFRSSTALRAVPDRPLPEQKRSLCVRFARCRAPPGPGLRCSGSSALAASSHNAVFCSLRRSPLRPSLQGEPRFARLSLWPSVIHPLSPQPSRKLLRASARRCRTSAQLPRRPRCRLRLHRSPRCRVSFDHGTRCFPFRRSPVPGEGSGEKKNSLMVGEVEAFSNLRKSGP